MGVSERRKGANGERELVRLLRDELGDDITRNLVQTRDGGCDLLGVPPFAVEVKRAETLRIPEWWRQACEQAEREGLVPALAYRQSRQPWAFMVPLNWLFKDVYWGNYNEKALLSLRGFCYVVREYEVPD